MFLSKPRFFVQVVLASALVGAGMFAACTDSYRSDDPGATGGAGGSTGVAQGGSGQGGDILGDGGVCENTCSNDLKKVVNCLGAVIQECTPDQGCANAQCIDNPCQAAIESKSSYGCDYWAYKTALLSSTRGACFAAFIANTWERPVHIQVQRNGVDLPVANFAYIPEGQGAPNAITYTPYDPAVGLEVGKVALLFLSRVSSAASAPDCPEPGALDAETGVSGTGRGDAFHITTDYPVVAYQMVPFAGGTAAATSATLLLPTSAWDTNYLAINAYSASDPPIPEGVPSLAILAQADGTEVTVLPKVAIQPGTNVAGSPVNTPVTYMLDAGDFLQITQAEELTGSVIESSQPVAVFGGHTCMTVPNNELDCDSAQQQIAPVRAMGSEYAAVRYRDRVGGANESPPWRLVGMVDGTQLTWVPDTPAGAPTTINRGQVVEFTTGEPFVVRSQGNTHPFYVGGYMTGGAPYNNIGDPDWVNVIPPSQFLDNYAFFTDPTYPETSLVVVRTRSLITGDFADVDLDCAGPLTGWQAIGDYEYTRVDLSTGNFQGVGNCANGRHEIRSALPFGVTIWGWGAIQQYQRVSYAYPAGAGFQPINEIVIPPQPE